VRVVNRHGRLRNATDFQTLLFGLFRHPSPVVLAVNQLISIADCLERVGIRAVWLDTWTMMDYKDLEDFYKWFGIEDVMYSRVLMLIWDDDCTMIRCVS
jgi:hypothetical protein